MNVRVRVIRAIGAAFILSGLVLAPGCGDTFRPIASPVITPGGDPQITDNITYLNSNGSNAGTALRIDVAGDTVFTGDRNGVDPGFAAYDANRGNYYVPNISADTVTSVGILGSVTTLTLQTGSHPTAVITGSSEQYVLNSGANADCPSSGSLGVMSTITLALLKNVCIGPSPVYGVQTGSNVFIVDNVSNQVYVYGIQQQAIVATVPVGTAPVWASSSYDRGYVYVINQGSSDITILNATTFAVVATVPTGGTGPVRTFLDRTLIRLYVVNQGDNTVSVFDASSNSTLTALHAAIPVGPTPSNITVLKDGTRAYTSNTGSNTLSEINTSSFTATSLVVGNDPTALVTDVASSTDGTKVYATATTANDLNNGATIIKTSSDSIVTVLPSPLQDPTCNTATTQCARQRPTQLLGGRS